MNKTTQSEDGVSHEETGSALVRGYLNQYPDCQHLTSPLEWDRDERSHDVVRGTFHSYAFNFTEEVGHTSLHVTNSCMWLSIGTNACSNFSFVQFQ